MTTLNQRCLKIQAVCDLIDCVDRHDLIAIITILGHPENKRFKLSHIGHAIISIMKSFDENRDQETIDDIFDFCVGRLYRGQYFLALCQKQNEEVDDHGDSLHDPRVTKEQLDEELDEMVQTRKRFVRFVIPKEDCF